MNASEVKALLESKIEGSQVTTDGADCSFQITIIAEAFEGLNAVKRQQLVYSHLQDAISSGAIHAITMKTYTPAQFASL